MVEKSEPVVKHGTARNGDTSASNTIQMLHAYFEFIAVMVKWLQSILLIFHCLSLSWLAEELRGRRYGTETAFKSSASEEMKKKP